MPSSERRLGLCLKEDDDVHADVAGVPHQGSEVQGEVVAPGNAEVHADDDGISAVQWQHQAKNVKG